MSPLESLANNLNNLLSSLFERFVDYLPQLITALLILIVGVLIAKWLKKLTIRVLKDSRLAKYLSSNPNLTNFLSQAEVKLKPEEVIGETVKWGILIVTFITVFDTLGLTTVSEFMLQLVGFLPQILSALIILVIGILAAGLVESLVKGAVSRLSIPTARVLAKASSYTILLFATMVAISELGIAEEFIQILFTGMVAMLAIGLGLAFGLGSKDLVKKLLEQWYDDISNERH